MNASRVVSNDRPLLVGIPACCRDLGGERYHIAPESYILAIVEMVGAIPVIIPALGEHHNLDTLLAELDGLLITGSASNVEPTRYGGPHSDLGTLHDPWRDATNLQLIPAAVAAGVPLLAVCRGFQEMNVAYGGSLHQKLHELPGRLDHRADPRADIDVQFGPSHAVRLTQGGLLRRLLDVDSATVNSLHWQGVDRLAGGLMVEAVAEDGTVEAFSVASSPGFALAVQWHPEHRPAENPVSRAIFAAFADAVRARHNRPSAGAA